MAARAIGCFILLLVLVWLVSVGAVGVILFRGGPHAFVGPWATIAAIGFLFFVLVVALLMPAVPHSRKGRVEIALPPEQVFDAMSDLQWLAGIPGLREVRVTYSRARDELQQRRTTIGVGRVAAYSMERIASERPAYWVTRYRAGGRVLTTTRRLSATSAGTLLEVEEVGRLGIFVSTVERFRSSDPIWAAQLERVKADLEGRPR
jgi:hypothetical protein